MSRDCASWSREELERVNTHLKMGTIIWLKKNLSFPWAGNQLMKRQRREFFLLKLKVSSLMFKINVIMKTKYVALLWKPSTLKYQLKNHHWKGVFSEWILDFLTPQTPQKSTEGEHISAVNLYYCALRLTYRKEHFLLIKEQTKRADLKDFSERFIPQTWQTNR